MKVQYLPLIQAADLHITDAGARSRIIAAAVASAIANSLALPTTEVENVSSHYAQTLQIPVSRQVAEFNENVVFDLPYAVNLVRALWLIRYTAAHPSSKPIFGGECSFFETFIGVSLYVDAETCCFLTEHKKAICVLAMGACDILCAAPGQSADSEVTSSPDRMSSNVTGYGQRF
ncbi:hypothetical protein D3C71_79360 [compost metagenome]